MNDSVTVALLITTGATLGSSIVMAYILGKILYELMLINECSRIEQEERHGSQN